MGKPLALGAFGGGVVPPAGELANSLAQGVLTAPGLSEAVQIFGAFNVAFWASITDALTTVSGSNAAVVASGTNLAAGVAINSVNVPPGTTIGTIVGTNITLNFPTISLEAQYLAGMALITDLPFTNGLVGATVTGPGWPAGTTVTGIVTPFAPGPNGGNQFGVVKTSAAPTQDSAPIGSRNPNTLFSSGGNDRLLFALGSQSVTTGTDAAASFTGAGISYTGTVQLEYSFDGGLTWLVSNVGGSGQLAQYSAGTPVRFILGEVEQGVGYRLNVATLLAGNVNWRISTTGQAATSLSISAGA